LEAVVVFIPGVVARDRGACLQSLACSQLASWVGGALRQGLRPLNLCLLNPRFDVAHFHAPPRPNLVRRWSDAALQVRSQSVWTDGRALCGFIEGKKTIVVVDI
jgi:hypothetical protein